MYEQTDFYSLLVLQIGKANRNTKFVCVSGEWGIIICLEFFSDSDLLYKIRTAQENVIYTFKRRLQEVQEV